jgi:hypothetical protein
MWGNGLDRAGSGSGQVAGTCEYGNELSGSINAGNFLASCKPGRFSRRTLLHGVSKCGYLYIAYILVLQSDDGSRNYRNMSVNIIYDKT